MYGFVRIFFPFLIRFIITLISNGDDGNSDEMIIIIAGGGVVLATGCRCCCSYTKFKEKNLQHATVVADFFLLCALHSTAAAFKAFIRGFRFVFSFSIFLSFLH